MDALQVRQIYTRIQEQTPLTKRFVAVLYDFADWTTRAQIAVKLSKSRLTPHDLNVLEKLVALDMAESVKRSHRGNDQIIYRLRGDVHEAINEMRLHARKKV